MDYECDYGYTRPFGTTGTCNLDMDEAAWAKAEAKRQKEQCEEYGYYEQTMGYRKVPGDICTAGIQLAPYIYQCNTAGYLTSIFTVRGIFVLAVFAAVFYFGWPIIEAILITLPLPDPKHAKEQLMVWLTKVRVFLGGVIPQLAPGQKKEREGYLQDFEMAPGSYAEDDDEDDSNDIGQKAGFGEDNLNYDSDEKAEEAESSELIALDTLPKPQHK